MSRFTLHSSASRWRRLAPPAVLALVTLTLVSPAAAYRTAGDLAEFAETERVRWAWGEIRYRIFNGLPESVEMEDLALATEAAFARWSVLECGGPRFIHEGAAITPAGPDDRVSTIEWVAEGWAARGFPAGAAAFTDVTYTRLGGGTWEIREADLYINGADHRWTVSGPLEAGTRLLSATLTHEAGHMLGLFHPCEDDGALGAPACATDPSFGQSTMHPVYDEARDALGEDDVAGACFLYANDGAAPDGGVSPEPPCANEGCLPGPFPPGDPCTAAADCASRYCNADGACGASCREDDECPVGGSCSVDPAIGGICSAGLALGAGCSTPEECLGGVCLRSSENDSMCSRGCGDTPCPEGWSCGPVDGDEVCFPSQALASGGCTTSRSTPGATGPAPVLLLLAAAMTRALSPRRRRGTQAKP